MGQDDGANSKDREDFRGLLRWQFKELERALKGEWAKPSLHSESRRLKGITPLYRKGGGPKAEETLLGRRRQGTTTDGIAVGKKLG